MHTVGTIVIVALAVIYFGEFQKWREMRRYRKEERERRRNEQTAFFDYWHEFYNSEE